MELTCCQKKILNKLTSLDNQKQPNQKEQKLWFVLGPAGSGKSVLIEALYRRLPSVTYKIALSNIAAQNIDGQTIHTEFCLNIDNTFDSNERFLRIKHKLQFVKNLIIDEISFVSIELFLMIEKICRISLNKWQLFGGLNVFLFGDFSQLTSPSNSSCFIFQHKIIWQKFQKAALHENLRNTNVRFQQHLKLIRVNENTRECLIFFNQYFQSQSHFHQLALEDYILLSFTNRIVDQHNANVAEKILVEQTESKKFQILIKTSDKCELITICSGMKFFTTKKKHGGVNKRNQLVLVDVDNTGSEQILKFQFSDNGVKRKYVMHSELFGNGKNVFHLAYGYALTVHKSQSLTIPNLIFDPTGCEYSCNLVYTAISRCSIPQNFVLKTKLLAKHCVYNRHILQLEKTLLELIAKD